MENVSWSQALDDLQKRMEEQALEYKGTKLNPFYEFIIGKLSWEDCLKQVAEEFKSLANRRQL